MHITTRILTFTALITLTLTLPAASAEWNLVFEDAFERDEVGENYLALGAHSVSCGSPR